MPPQSPTWTRPLYLLLGWFFFALGAVGVVLPLVPTTPFMLLALWAFARGSRRFHDWLYHHRLFGPPLRRWRDHRVVPPGAKLAAVTAMGLSSGWLLFFSPAPPAFAVTAALSMAAVAVYLLTRPSRAPRRLPVADRARDGERRTALEAIRSALGDGRIDEALRRIAPYTAVAAADDDHKQSPAETETMGEVSLEELREPLMELVELLESDFATARRHFEALRPRLIAAEHGAAAQRIDRALEYYDVNEAIGIARELLPEGWGEGDARAGRYRGLSFNGSLPPE